MDFTAADDTYFVASVVVFSYFTIVQFLYAFSFESLSPFWYIGNSVICFSRWKRSIQLSYEESKCTWDSDLVYSLFPNAILIQSNLNNSNSDGSFTVTNSNSFLSPCEILPIAQENKYSGKFSYFIMKLCVVCTHKNRLIEAILMSTLSIQLLCRKSRKKSLNYRCLLPDLAPWLTSEARTTLVSNNFLWSQRCSSHWSSTVVFSWEMSSHTSSIKYSFSYFRIKNL